MFFVNENDLRQGFFCVYEKMPSLLYFPHSKQKHKMKGLIMDYESLMKFETYQDAVKWLVIHELDHVDIEEIDEGNGKGFFFASATDEDFTIFLRKNGKFS